MHALENTTEILFNPKIRDVIENKFKLYLKHNEKTKHKQRLDKKSFIEVFE